MQNSIIYVTFVIEIREYLRNDNSSPFSEWFNSLNSQAAAKVTAYLIRIEGGNTSSLKSIGAGVFESRIHWGPGYRIYFGLEGNNIMILLGGGTKKQQQRDISVAKELWEEYKERKKTK